MPTPIIQELGFDVVQAVNNLNQLNGSITSFNRRINALSRNLQNFNQSGRTVSTTMQQVGQGANHLNAVTKGAQRLTVSWETLVRVVATQLIVKTLRRIQQTFNEASASAIRFQTSVAEIQTLAEGSLGSLDQAAQNIREVSDAFNTPLDQTSAALYETLSSQVADGAEAYEFLGTAAKFARSTQTELDDAIQLLSGTINAFGLEASDAELLASKFFRIIDLGNVRGNQLAQTFNVITGQASQLGLSFDEVGAAVSVLTRRGVPFRQAITQISGILNGLTKQSTEARTILRELGFETAQQAIQSRGLGGILTDLANAQGNVAEEIAKVFPRVRALRGALALGSQAAEDFASDAEALRSTLSTLNQEKFDEIANIDAERLSREFQKFSNFLTTEVGPAVNSVTLGTLDLIGGMDNLTGFLRNSEAGFVGLATAATLYVARSRLAVFETNKLAAALGRFAGPALAIGLGVSIAEFIGREIEESSSAGQRAAIEAGKKLLEETRKQEQERLRIVTQTNSDIFRSLTASFQDASKLYTRETEEIERATSNFQDNVQSSLKSTVDANKSLLDQLRQISDDVNNIVTSSANRVTDLQNQISDRQFGRQLQGQDAGRQVSSLRGRAEDIARSASRLLSNAATDSQVNRALEQFRRAEGFANQALQLAGTLDSSASTFASRTLDDINRRQIRAERQLQSLQQERAQEADKLRQRQQSITEEIQAQAKIVAENLDPQTGDAETRQAALRRIEQLRLSRGDESALERLGLGNFVDEFRQELQRSPLTLQFSVEQQIETIKAQIQQSFENFEVRIGLDVAQGVEDLVGRNLQGPGQFAQGIDEIQKESDALQRAISQRKVDLTDLQATQREFIGLSNDLVNPTREGLRNASSLLAPQDQKRANQLLKSLAQDLRQFGTDGSASKEQVDSFNQSMLDLFNIVDRAPSAFGFSLSGFLGDDAGKIADIFPKLQDFLTNVQNLEQNTIDQDRVNQLTTFLDAAKARVDQIKTAGDTALDGMVRDSQTIRDNLAGDGAALNRRFGGNIPGFANGGQARGTDTVLAGLTPGEFVVNKRASQRFFSQLQAINAGVRPRFQDGGPVTNVGDVTINVNESATPRLTGREVATALRREFRRGTSRL